MRSDRGRSRRGRVRSEEGGSQKIDGTYVRGWQRGRSETMCQMEAKARLPKKDRCEFDCWSDRAQRPDQRSMNVTAWDQALRTSYKGSVNDTAWDQAA